MVEGVQQGPVLVGTFFSLRLGLGFGLHPTILGWGFLACVVVCALRLYPAVPGSGVRCGRVYSGPGCGCAPLLLGEVLGCVCVCVLVPPGPLHLLAGGAVQGGVLWPGLLPRPTTPGSGVGACVCLCACPACTPPFLAWVCGVGVCAGLGCRLCPATLGWGVGVCVPRLHPAVPGGVLCVCVGLGFVCSPVFLPSWLGCWGAWPLVRAASVSSHLLGGRQWRGGVRVLLWVGLCPPPPSPLVFFWGGGRRGVSCRGFVVLVAGCPGLGSPGLRPPFPFVRAAPSCVFCFFSVFAPAWCVSACSGCPFFRWAAALGLVLPVFAGRSSGAPSGGPVFGAVWLGGLAASCGVCGRFRGCGLYSCPPPFCFFRGGVCLFLPLHSLGWCTHWSAFGVVNRVAVGAFVLLGLAPAPWVGWVMYTFGSAALPAGLGSGSAGWAVAPGGFVRPWVRGAGVFRVPA